MDHTCYQESRITRNEKDIQDIWDKREGDKKEVSDSLRYVHGRIDAMKNWFVIGMGSMTLYFLVVIVEFLLKSVAE